MPHRDVPQVPGKKRPWWTRITKPRAVVDKNIATTRQEWVRRPSRRNIEGWLVMRLPFLGWTSSVAHSVRLRCVAVRARSVGQGGQPGHWWRPPHPSDYAAHAECGKRTSGSGADPFRRQGSGDCAVLPVLKSAGPVPALRLRLFRPVSPLPERRGTVPEGAQSNDMI